MDTTTTLLKTLFPCLPLPNTERNIQLPSELEKPHLTSKPTHHPNDLLITQTATSIASTLLTAPTAGPSLDRTITQLVHDAGGWSYYLAQKTLSALENALRAGLGQKKMGAAMQLAFDKACEAAKMIAGFIAEHPFTTAVFCTVIAIGVLVVLAPEVLGWLGFAELGPMEGSFAARWMAGYGGYVPKRSLYSFLQRMGMTWKRL